MERRKKKLEEQLGIVKMPEAMAPAEGKKFVAKERNKVRNRVKKHFVQNSHELHFVDEIAKNKLGMLDRKMMKLIDKSELDWKAYKQHHGLQDELKKAERAGDGYIAEQQFIAKVKLNQGRR